MLLAVQIQMMLYAFLLGFVYGILFSLIQFRYLYRHNKFQKGIVKVLFHIIFVCIAYFGLYKLNGGISNIYLYLLFFSGIYLYYLFYYEIFLNLFFFLSKKLRPFYLKSYLLFSKYYSIMKGVKERKKKHAEKKSRKKKKFHV